MNELNQQREILNEDKPLAPSPLFSPWSNPALAARMAELWIDLPASQVAKKLSAEFNIKLTRNSIVGRAFRVGLTAKDKSEEGKRAAKQNTPINRPHLKIVVNGGGLRLLQSVESDMPALRVIAAEPLNLTLAELTKTTCRYIAGSDHLHCGHTTFGEKPFCLAHCQICYLPPNERNMRARGCWK